MEKQIKEDLEL
jgi:hypothetical protein